MIVLKHCLDRAEVSPAPLVIHVALEYSLLTQNLQLRLLVHPNKTKDWRWPLIVSLGTKKRVVSQALLDVAEFR